MRTALFDSRTTPLTVASLAGGPGFDYAAVLLAAGFLGSTTQVHPAMACAQRRSSGQELPRWDARACSALCKGAQGSPLA